jgi:hypothetical protein
MKKSILLLIIFFARMLVQAQEKEDFRLIVMTDMTHDDDNSLVRLLHYAPWFDFEAIVVTPQLPDYKYGSDKPWNRAQDILKAYKEEEDQLKKHDPDFPSYEKLKSITKRGRGALPIIWLTNEEQFAGQIADRKVKRSWEKPTFSEWIGEGKNPHGDSKDSEASEYLQEVFDREDDRPIFVEFWGGSITFVQALYRYKQRKSAAEFQELLDKLHIYSIHLQDITFDYMINLDHVQDLNCLNMGDVTSTYRGDRIRPGWFLFDAGHFWKYINVMKPGEIYGHGPMSELYDSGGEGDTPSFLYLISARLGLNDPLKPTQGSWGGRFKPLNEPFSKNYYSTCKVDTTALYRWIPAVKNNFLERLDWSVKDPDEVNHVPNAVLNGDGSEDIVYIEGEPGETIHLNANSSTDPDGDSISFHWFYYEEASGYQGDVNITNPTASQQSIRIPENIGDEDLHIILEVHDDGDPPLVSYKRVVIKST